MKHRLISCALFVFAASCSHAKIPGTMVRDTKENREVYDVIRELQQAFVARSADRLLALVSHDYYEDMGTPDAKDDYGYDVLKTRVLPKLEQTLTEAHMAIEVHDIIIADGYAHADVRYDTRGHMNLKSGEQWARHNEFNRITFKRDGKAWKIISGL